MGLSPLLISAMDKQAQTQPTVAVEFSAIIED